MENGNKDGGKNTPGKKELTKQLADKMQTALPELRELLGEKKFENRLRKAAKLLMEGLHKQDITKKKNQPAAKAATKKQGIKKAAVKKTVVKQTAPKTSTPNKAKNTKKTGTRKQ